CRGMLHDDSYLTLVCSLFASASSVYYSVYSFFFHHTATPQFYTLSLHDALPICRHRRCGAGCGSDSRGSSVGWPSPPYPVRRRGDRKSTRLNSSHQIISYAVFCLKKKTIITNNKQMVSNDLQITFAGSMRQKRNT